VKSLPNNYHQIKSANWHVTTRCNYNCRFCFSQKLGKEIDNLDYVKKILEKLNALKIEKMNFVGGEPLLHPLIFDVVRLAKSMGFVVSVVSNGYYLDKKKIFDLSPFVDWIGISVDSQNEHVEKALGRGDGNHVKHIIEIADFIHEAGIKLKINTTVTRLNWTENMQPLIRRLKPSRWKVFQVLYIQGQNDQHFSELSITDDQFEYFKSINQEPLEGTTTVFEGNDAMLASYFMLSPGGMVMSNKDGANRALIPLESVNQEKLSQVVDVDRYIQRGGNYSW